MRLVLGRADQRHAQAGADHGGLGLGLAGGVQQADQLVGDLAGAARPALALLGAEQALGALEGGEQGQRLVAHGDEAGAALGPVGAGGIGIHHGAEELALEVLQAGVDVLDAHGQFIARVRRMLRGRARCLGAAKMRGR